MENNHQDLVLKFEQPKSEVQIKSFDFIDLIAYFGGLWFFFTQCVVGPLIKRFISKRLFVAELGEQLFYSPKYDDYNKSNGRNGRVKIDVGAPYSD